VEGGDGVQRGFPPAGKKSTGTKIERHVNGKKLPDKRKGRLGKRKGKLLVGENLGKP